MCFALAAWVAWPPFERVKIAPVVAATQVDRHSNGATLVVGSAWFEVRAEPSNPWRGQAGDVEVLISTNTRFSMERTLDHVRITVDSGAVNVRWPGGKSVVNAGMTGSFPPAAVVPPVEPQPLTDEPEVKPLAPKAPSRPLTSWQELAQGGRFDEAWVTLQKATNKPLRDVPEELLLAADVARLSHHPEEAVAPLQQCVSHHAVDPRAPLAAFTLGRVLLDALGRPREAAQAFSTAQRLAPSGPLAEDALARAVESWSRAGETALAREAAQTYLRRFPDGRREAAVRHHGGLE
jgi:transmembrane sensor